MCVCVIHRKKTSSWSLIEWLGRWVFYLSNGFTSVCFPLREIRHLRTLILQREPNVRKGLVNMTFSSPLQYLKPIFHCDAKLLALGLCVWSAPNTKICIGDTNMLVSKNVKICITPNAKPQHESVEYRWRWVPNATFLHWLCTFHLLCVDFICIGSRFLVEHGL